MRVPGLDIKARTERSSAPGPGGQSLKEVTIKAGAEGSVSLGHRTYLPLIFCGPETTGWERKQGEKEAFVEQAF